MKHRHPSLLYALCSVPCSVKIRRTNPGSLTSSFSICYPVGLIIPLSYKIDYPSPVPKVEEHPILKRNK